MNMPGGTGRGRRRRGRRGQRGRQEAQQQVQLQGTAPDQAPADAPAETRVEPQPEREERRAAQRPDGDDPQQAGDQQQERKGAGRKRSRGRRNRPTKRPALAAQPTEVLKPRVRDVPVTGTMTMRTLDEVETPGGMTFGCPMLTRTRMGMPFVEGRRMPRCSMGWALHNEEEASFCMRTPDLLDCWKAHPEREAELRGTRETENAAD